MVDNKVLISVITGEYGRRADFYDFMNLLEKPANTSLAFCHDRSPAHGRNLIVEAALEDNYTHILFMDDDVAPERDALNRLLSHNVNSISGLYLQGSYPHQPLIFDDFDEQGHAFFSYLEDDVKGLKPIAAAGLGFYLVKTDVFRQLEKPWFRLGELDPEQWCDDIGFFHRLRKLDIQTYCDLDVKIGHIRSYIVRPEYRDGKWLTSYDTGGKGSVSTPQISIPSKYTFEGDNGIGRTSK